MAKRDLTAAKERIESEGANAAVTALLRVCNDPNASSQALATAGSALLRAAGLFEKIENPREKEPHEMDAFELQEAIDDLVQKAADSKRAAAVLDDDEFGEEVSIFD